MKKTRRKELAKQYKETILYMLDRNPSSDYWNEQLKFVNELLRKLK